MQVRLPEPARPFTHCQRLEIRTFCASAYLSSDAHSTQTHHRAASHGEIVPRKQCCNHEDKADLTSNVLRVAVSRVLGQNLEVWGFKICFPQPGNPWDGLEPVTISQLDRIKWLGRKQQVPFPGH